MKIHHYRATDGIDGYAPGDLLHCVDDDTWQRAVADGRGVVLEPCRDAALAEAIADMVRAVPPAARARMLAAVTAIADEAGPADPAGRDTSSTP